MLSGPSHAVWLLPTPEFRQAVFERRGGPQWGFIGKTSNPERALRNILARDALFTDQLYQETKLLNLHSIPVDTTITVEDLTSRVMKAFGLDRHY